MPKKTEYVTDEELTNTVSSMLSNIEKLQALRDNNVVILCCMKVRMDDDGETEPPKGSPVKLKKLSDLERLFVEGNAHYILTMDYHYWKNSDQKQQWKKLFDELMDIQPEPTETGLKLKKRAPTCSTKHVESYELFGACDDETLAVRDAMKNTGGRIKDFIGSFVSAPATATDAADEALAEPEPEPEPEPESPEPEPAPKSKGKNGNKK